MSIRHFHVFFMSICILFFLGFAGFGFLQSGEDPSKITMGILFAALGLGLIGYLIYFIKKIKREGLDS